MLILHPERSRSTFFKVLPFLTSDDFESFRGEIRSALIGAKDPMENSLDVVVPGPCEVAWISPRFISPFECRDQEDAGGVHGENP